MNVQVCIIWSHKHGMKQAYMHSQEKIYPKIIPNSPTSCSKAIGECAFSSISSDSLRRGVVVLLVRKHRILAQWPAPRRLVTASLIHKPRCIFLVLSVHGGERRENVRGSSRVGIRRTRRSVGGAGTAQLRTKVVTSGSVWTGAHMKEGSVAFHGGCCVLIIWLPAIEI